MGFAITLPHPTFYVSIKGSVLINQNFKGSESLIIPFSQVNNILRSIPSPICILQLNLPETQYFSSNKIKELQILKMQLQLSLYVWRRYCKAFNIFKDSHLIIKNVTFYMLPMLLALKINRYEFLF